MSNAAVPRPSVPVEIVMGSSSDAPVMQGAADVLGELGVPCVQRVVSAHRTPLDMVEFGQRARARGTRVIIAGAGGAAHLPGMLASLTTLPVLGVPVPLARLDGLDSLLSIVQMPNGVPVGTVGIGASRNAGILAARILSLDDTDLAARLEELARASAAAARAQDAALAPSE